MLTTRRYRELLEVTELMLGVRTPPDVPGILLPAVATLIDATLVIYHRTTDPGSDQIDIGWPPQLFTIPLLEPYARLAGQHPLVRHLASLGSANCARPVTVLDLVPDRHWQSTEIYREAMAPLGGDDQMLVVLQASSTSSELLSLTRWSGRFGDDDRETLRWIRPHVVAALHRALAAPGPGRIAMRVRPVLQWVSLDDPGPIPTILTAREQEILIVMSAGVTTSAAARRLGISPRTVSKHLENAYRKLGVTGLVEATLSTGGAIGPSVEAPGRRPDQMSEPI